VTVSYETLLVGMLLALLFTELADIYPGGIIVPAYFAMNLQSYPVVILTLVVSFLSLGTYRLLSRRLILFGRRRFVMIVLLGIVWGQLALLALPLAAPDAQIRLIGWIIPGLLANNLERQRIVPTLAGLAGVSVASYFVVKLIGIVF